MIIPNASITSYRTHQGRLGDGSSKLSESVVVSGRPILCRTRPPTFAQQRTAEATGTRADRMIDVASGELALRGVSAAVVGDRITLLHAGTETDLVVIVVERDESGGLAGSVRYTRLTCRRAT